MYLLGYTWVYSQGKQLRYSFVQGIRLHLQIRASPKNKFELRGVHLNPHAKCRSSKVNLKLFKKKKRKTGVTLNLETHLQ